MLISELNPMPLPEFISSDRLELKRLAGTFAEKLFHTIDSDRTRMSRFLPWVNTTLTVKDSRNYIDSTDVARERLEGFDFGIFKKSDGEYLGNIGVHAIAWKHRVCEIGYWLTQLGEGNGYASEAVSILEQTLFAIGFHRIEIRCSSENFRSANVPKRCNYSLEGQLSENLIENGKYRSTLIFAKINSQKTIVSD